MTENENGSVGCDDTCFVSVELSEADFSDPSKRAVALGELKEELEKQKCGQSITRPRFNVLHIVLNVALPLVLSAAVFCLLFFLLPAYNLQVALGVSLGGLFLYFLIRLKSVCIFFIRVYQRFAPEATRRRCVFTPTCSEYAISALQKYGVIRAVPKIINRLKRCHPPNGGNDPLE